MRLEVHAHPLLPPEAIAHAAHFAYGFGGSFRWFAMHQLVQDQAGRIRAISVGVAPGAIQEGVRKILVAEEDFDRGIGQRHRPKSVALVVRTYSSSGSILKRHASYLVQLGIEFAMQMRHVTSSGDGVLELNPELLFDQLAK